MVSLLRDDPFELQPAHLLIKGPAAPDLVTRVFAGDWTPLSPLLRPAERLVYWCCGVDETEEQSWRAYAVSMLFFGVAGFITLYALQRLQSYLPFNPQGQAGVEQVLAFNTAVSFVTNTNWQSYVPETTMGYLVQMAGLTVHNFVSAAVGIVLAIALIRGFARHEAGGIGNFARSLLWRRRLA